MSRPPVANLDRRIVLGALVSLLLFLALAAAFVVGGLVAVAARLAFLVRIVRAAHASEIRQIVRSLLQRRFERQEDLARIRPQVCILALSRKLQTTQ